MLLLVIGYWLLLYFGLIQVQKHLFFLDKYSFQLHVRVTALLLMLSVIVHCLLVEQPVFLAGCSFKLGSP